jgi:hypothetical protein
MENCTNCKFSKTYINQSSAKRQTICLRYPPKYFHSFCDGIQIHVIKVDDSIWCGEYKEKI